MVRKVITAFLLVMLLGVTTLQANAVAPYDGNFSSSYTSVFESVISDNFYKDYVCYRQTENEYVLYMGDLSYNNGVFTGSDLTLYSYVVNNYNTYNYYNVYHGQSLSLTVGNHFVYSNLGNFPDLIESGVYLDYAFLSAFVALCVAFVLRSVFAFVYRVRSR